MMQRMQQFQRPRRHALLGSRLSAPTLLFPGRAFLPPLLALVLLSLLSGRVRLLWTTTTTTTEEEDPARFFLLNNERAAAASLTTPA
jgi:hypothetical protein